MSLETYTLYEKCLKAKFLESRYHAPQCPRGLADHGQLRLMRKGPPAKGCYGDCGSLLKQQIQSSAETLLILKFNL